MVDDVKTNVVHFCSGMEKRWKNEKHAFKKRTKLLFGRKLVSIRSLDELIFLNQNEVQKLTNSSLISFIEVFFFN